MKTQSERLNPEPLSACRAFKPGYGTISKPGKCTYPVCHCYDSDIISKEEADKLLASHIEGMLERLRSFLDDLKYLLSRPHYMSREQLRIYRKRKARLQKNFDFWHKKYMTLKYNKLK